MTVKEKEQEPATIVLDDPREAVKYRVGDLVVDQNVQRATDPGRIVAMGPWDYDLAEGLTVALRDNGDLVVIEGQTRVLKLRGISEDATMWGLQLEGVHNEAGIALAIAKSRKYHTPYDKWQLRLHQGAPLETAAEEILANLGLRLYNGGAQDGFTITAVGSVERLMKYGETPQEGAELLEQTLSTIMTAWPSPSESSRFDGHIIGFIGRLFARNDNVQPVRLIQILMTWLPGRWLQEGRDRNPGRAYNEAIGMTLIGLYNKQLGEKNKLRW